MKLSRQNQALATIHHEITSRTIQKLFDGDYAVCTKGMTRSLYTIEQVMNNIRSCEQLKQNKKRRSFHD